MHIPQKDTEKLLRRTEETYDSYRKLYIERNNKTLLDVSVNRATSPKNKNKPNQKNAPLPSPSPSGNNISHSTNTSLFNGNKSTENVTLSPKMNNASSLSKLF